MSQAMLAIAYVDLGHEVVVVDPKPWKEWDVLVPKALGIDCFEPEQIGDLGEFDRVITAL